MMKATGYLIKIQFIDGEHEYETERVMKIPDEYKVNGLQAAVDYCEDYFGEGTTLEDEFTFYEPDLSRAVRIISAHRVTPEEFKVLKRYLYPWFSHVTVKPEEM